MTDGAYWWVTIGEDETVYYETEEAAELACATVNALGWDARIVDARPRYGPQTPQREIEDATFRVIQKALSDYILYGTLPPWYKEPDAETYA